MYHLAKLYLLKIICEYVCLGCLGICVENLINLLLENIATHLLHIYNLKFIFMTFANSLRYILVSSNVFFIVLWKFFCSHIFQPSAT